MNEHEPQTPPERDSRHDDLEVFLGDWRAEGWSYGNPEQNPDDPKSLRDKWTSAHAGRWHTGQFFLVQDEKAMIGSERPVPFDTLSVFGVDSETGEYFVRSFENHGFYRRYQVRRNARVWTLTGATERARIEFSEDGEKQTVCWEWLKNGRWLPLCDRVAARQN